jgi:hypothetical protein
MRVRICVATQMRSFVDDLMPISGDGQDPSFLKRTDVKLRKLDGQKSILADEDAFHSCVWTICNSRLDTATVGEQRTMASNPLHPNRMLISIEEIRQTSRNMTETIVLREAIPLLVHL